MSREAMQMALEALEQYKGVVVTQPDPESFRLKDVDGGQAARAAIAALRQALAEPDSDYERGFVDGMNLQTKGSVDKAVNRIADPLYTAPSTRKPLTEEEIVRLMVGEDRVQLLYAKPDDPYFSEFAQGAIRELVESGRAIERAHGIGEQHGS